MKTLMTLAFVALMTTVSFAENPVCTPNETYVDGGCLQKMSSETEYPVQPDGGDSEPS